MTFVDPHQAPEPDVSMDARNRAYLIVPDGGTDYVEYLRTTIFIDLVENAGYVGPWHRRELLKHFATDPAGITARITEALNHPDLTPAKALDALALALLDEAGCNEARDYGSEAHEALRCSVLGLPFTPADRFAADIAVDLPAVLACMAAHGIALDPAYVEVPVLCERFAVAGRTDGITTPGPAGRRVVDLKTGSKPDPVKWATQLAVYAHAEWVVSDNGRTLTPMPDDIDRVIGYVVHCPRGSGKATVWAVDLEQGYAAAELAAEVRRHQALGVADGGVRVEQPVGEWRTEADPFAGMPGYQSQGPSPVLPQGDGPASATASTEVVPTPSDGGPAPACTPERRAWIVTRVRTIAAATADPQLLVDVNQPSAAHLLAAWWPEGVPTLAEVDTHTDAQVDAIAEGCALVEAALALPFPDEDPAHPFRPETLAGDHPDVVALVDRMRRLPSDLLATVEANAAAVDGMVPVTSGRITPDQLNEIDALVELAEREAGERLAAVAALNSSLSFMGVPLDEVIAAATGGRHRDHTRLTEAQLARFWALVDALETQALAWRDGLVVDRDADLLARYGNRRKAVAVAKAHAIDHGLPVPRSFAELVGDPTLVALVLGDETAPATDAAA